MIHTDPRTALWSFTSQVEALSQRDASVARLISNDHTIRGCGFNMERTAQRSALPSPGASSGLKFAAGSRAAGDGAAAGISLWQHGHYAVSSRPN
jgi:hypothetical protein